VADHLASFGSRLTVVDYTDEMVELGKQRLPTCEVVKADLRALPFKEQFDAVLVVGRVFTHMVTDEDLTAGLQSCLRSLKPSGRLFADNYEDSRIQVTTYFNGIIRANDEAGCSIVRTSSTKRISVVPFVVDWTAQYNGVIEGNSFSFSDSIQHRAFSRPEFAAQLGGQAFDVLAQGDNFDETSFYTLAQKRT